MFDILSAVELTASAAVATAAVAIGIGRSVSTRLWLTLGLAVWFVAVAIIAATGAVDATRGAGVSGVGLTVVIPLMVLVVALFAVPTLRAGVENASLVLLTAANAVRLLGVSFVLLHAEGRLPAPFAPVAGWGDMAVGIAALPVAWLVARRGTGWRGVLLAWNAVGLADLTAAVTLGVLSSPGPLRLILTEPGAGLMATLPWLLIPGFLVPLLATTHIVVFYRLWRSESPGETGGR